MSDVDIIKSVLAGIDRMRAELADIESDLAGLDAARQEMVMRVPGGPHLLRPSKLRAQVLIMLRRQAWVASSGVLDLCRTENRRAYLMNRLRAELGKSGETIVFRKGEGYSIQPLEARP